MKLPQSLHRFEPSLPAVQSLMSLPPNGRTASASRTKRTVRRINATDSSQLNEASNLLLRFQVHTPVASTYLPDHPALTHIKQIFKALWPKLSTSEWGNEE